MKRHLFATLLAGWAFAQLMPATAVAQSGEINRAVGGYSFQDAAQEAPATRNFRSKDGKLTFAIVTHTAGNGFFDPVYVGAQVAAKAFGINLIMLGSEATVDDIPREIAILNRIVQDPAIDGVILTTAQSGAFDDIVRQFRARNIPVATMNSYDPKLVDRNQISHTGQDASAAAIGGEALAKCLLSRNVKGGTVIFPNTALLGNEEVNRRIMVAYQATVKALNAAGRLRDFKVDAGSQSIGIDVDRDDLAGSVAKLIETRKDVVGAFAANGFVTTALGDAIARLKLEGQVCSFGFDLGPRQRDQIRSGALTGSLGQQPFLQGFWPVVQLYLQIDRGISAANLDTRAQLVTRETVDLVGRRFEN
ncbi:MAG: substrate-binding domain-containing protein [Alsobacter sp.]